MFESVDGGAHTFDFTDKHSSPSDEQVLLDFKANINAVDFNGDTSLSKAARAGMVDVVETLLAAGAELDVRDVENNIAGDVFNKKASDRCQAY